MAHHKISNALNEFFWAEARNTDQARRNGDLDPDFPLTLGTALDSLNQAPDDALVLWMAGSREGDVQAWADTATGLLDFANLIAQYGPDASLYDFMRED